MKRIRLLGLALIAVFALGAMASASAFAENPEILPVPTEAKPASFTATGGVATLTGTKESNKVECQKVTGKGSFTSIRLGTTTIEFKECKASGLKCKSPGAGEGEIRLKGGVHLVDVLPTGTLDLGVAITPHEFTDETKDLTFVCGGILTITVLGTVIGVVNNSAGALLKDLEKGTVFGLVYTQSKVGEQSIKTCDLDKAFCEGKTYLLESGFGGAEELTSEVASATLTFASAIEAHF